MSPVSPLLSLPYDLPDYSENILEVRIFFFPLNSRCLHELSMTNYEGSRMTGLDTNEMAVLFILQNFQHYLDQQDMSLSSLFTDQSSSGKRRLLGDQNLPF